MDLYETETAVSGEKEIRTFFLISISLKGIISFFEIVAGVLAYFVPVAALTGFLSSLARDELAEDPGSFIATHSLRILEGISLPDSTFLALYLVSRGLIKLLLIIALLKNQLWAYPSSLLVLAGFVLYQAYEIVKTHSLFLIALTLFDLVVMYFIWREYKIVRSHKETVSTSSTFHE